MDEIKKSTVSTSEANESGIENKETDGLSQRQIIVKRFFKHKAAVASLITLISIFLVVYTSLGGHIKSHRSILKVHWQVLVMAGSLVVQHLI
jgi:hypothetical protein